MHACLLNCLLRLGARRLSRSIHLLCYYKKAAPVTSYLRLSISIYITHSSIPSNTLAVAAAADNEGSELANPVDHPVAEETEEQRNKFLVLRLYEALNARDHAAVHSLLAPDLEWWFHGPPAHQHMMRILTGATPTARCLFLQPRSVDALGSTVIAEGATDAAGYYWVHAWTVGPDGIITQLREYFNTDLTVTCLAAASSKYNKCVWQSRRPDRARNSFPGLLLTL